MENDIKSINFRVVSNNLPSTVSLGIDEVIGEMTEIYNWYVLNSTATFDMEATSKEAMKMRIADFATEYPVFVWLENGRVSGYCYAHPWKTKPAYRQTLETTIYLRPESKNRGIGTALMKSLIAECRQRGFVTLIACITAENQESCRFHERLGFERASYFRNVGSKFGRPLDVTDYQLLLTD